MRHEHPAQTLHLVSDLRLPQSLEETERLVQLGMAPADAAGGLRLGGGHDGFEAHLDGILDEVCAQYAVLSWIHPASPEAMPKELATHSVYIMTSAVLHPGCCCDVTNYCCSRALACFRLRAMRMLTLPRCLCHSAQSELLSSFISDDFQVAGLCEEPEFTSADFQPHPHDRHPQL